jgi:hypothetical protein
MRVATLIVGLVLVLGLFFQSLLVGGLSDVAGDEGSSSAAAVGVLMALIWIFGCALVIPLPRVAMALFILAGVLGFAASSEFPDLGAWGGISLMLALFSFFGWRGKRKADRRERERDELIRQAAGAQLVTAQSTAYLAQGIKHVASKAVNGPTRMCAACGEDIPATARFCASCGIAAAGSIA